MCHCQVLSEAKDLIAAYAAHEVLRFAQDDGRVWQDGGQVAGRSASTSAAPSPIWWRCCRRAAKSGRSRCRPSATIPVASIQAALRRRRPGVRKKSTTSSTAPPWSPTPSSRTGSIRWRWWRRCGFEDVLISAAADASTSIASTCRRAALAGAAGSAHRPGRACRSYRRGRAGAGRRRRDRRRSGPRSRRPAWKAPPSRCFHAYANSAHERAVGQALAAALPFVSLSHEVNPGDARVRAHGDDGAQRLGHADRRPLPRPACSAR